jgi:hypothetical protein
MMSILEQEVEKIVLRVLADRETETGQRDEAEDYRRRIAVINAKEFLTGREAALLLGCSDAHLRNLVRQAKKGRKRHPVPFRDLDGVITFPREDLLKWSAEPKQRLRSVS